MLNSLPPPKKLKPGEKPENNEAEVKVKEEPSSSSPPSPNRPPPDESVLLLEKVKTMIIHCSTCQEVLSSPIYQCSNGHLICNTCIEKIADCTKCETLLSEPRIRNKMLEKLCGNVKVPCSLQKEGCQVVTSMKRLKAHVDTCGFQPTKFCKEFLGISNCDQELNDASVVDHLKEKHNAETIDKSTFMLVLNGRRIPKSNEFLFNPLIITGLDSPLLIRVTGSPDSNLFLTCYLLRNVHKAELREYRVKYKLESKISTLEWSGFPASYRKFKKPESGISFCVPLRCLTKFFKDGKQEFKISVKVAVWEGSREPPSLREGMRWNVQLMEKSLENKSELGSGAVYSEITCDGCGSTPISNVRYKCLQCRNYDVCSSCMERGHHKRHIFVRIQDLEQNAGFLTKLTEIRGSHFQPLL